MIDMESGTYGRRTTRERILDSALEVFADKGYEGGAVREICTHAGTNVAAVNYHWGSKDALWAGACERASRWFMAVMEAAVDIEKPAVETLPAAIDALLESLSQDPRAIRMAMWAMLLRNEKQVTATRDAFRPAVEWCLHYSAKLEDELPDSNDIEVVFWLLLGQLVQVFGNPEAHRAYFGVEPSKPHHLNTIRESVFRGTFAALSLPLPSLERGPSVFQQPASAG